MLGNASKATGETASPIVRSRWFDERRSALNASKAFREAVSWVVMVGRSRPIECPKRDVMDSRAATVASEHGQTRPDPAPSCFPVALWKDIER